MRNDRITGAFAVVFVALIIALLGGAVVLAISLFNSQSRQVPSESPDNVPFSSYCDHGNRVYIWSTAITVAPKDPSCVVSE